VWSVSLDDVRDKSERQVLIDFIYKTTNQATKEVGAILKYNLFAYRRDTEKSKKDLYYSTLPYCKFLNLIIQIKQIDVTYS